MITSKVVNRYFSRNTVRVPKDLDAVTRIGDEVPASAAGLKPAQVNRIWAQAKALYRSGYHPGVTLCVRRHGEVILHRSLGHASGNGPGERDNDPRILELGDPICLFSSSKAITATLVHWLAENGVWSLDDPVCEFIPEFAAAGKHRISLRDVMAHQSGIPAFPPSISVQDAERWDLLVGALCAMPPDTRFHRRTAYHAITGGYILGEAIQRVTGAPIQALLDRAIREPMGMEHFTYGVKDGAEGQAARNYFVGPKLVKPLAVLAEQALGVGFEEACELSNTPMFHKSVVPAGNIYATADEACRFFQMLLDGGRYGDRQIFAPETVRNIVMPEGHIRFDHMLKIPMRYSAGMMLGHPLVSLYGARTPMAFGHLGFLNILCWADPERALSASILTTGKSILGPHLPPLVRLLGAINTGCSPLPHRELPRWTTGLPRGLAAAW